MSKWYKWYEYDYNNNKMECLWKIPNDFNEEDDGVYVQELRVSGKGRWTEVIRGGSGIMEYGAHSGRMEIKQAKEIKENGEIWSTERLEKRLRYGNRDGGTAFETFRPKFINFSVPGWIRKKLNLER